MWGTREFHAFSFYAQKWVHSMDVRGVGTKRRGRGIDFMPDQCREPIASKNSRFDINQQSYCQYFDSNDFVFFLLK
jgi:hypothetical protein